MASEYLKDLKNLFKSKKRLQEEETEAVQDAVQKEKGIVLKLEELEQKYNSTLDDDTPNFDEMFKPVTLERVNYDIPTDEEITQKAIEEVEKTYASKISDINAKTIEKIADEESKKTSADESRTKSLKKLMTL